MSKKIWTQNTSEVEKICSDLNGLYTMTVSRLQEAITECEKQIKLLPKKYWKGITLIISSGGERLPQSYKYTRKASLFVVKYGTRGWYISKIEDIYLYPGTPEYMTIYTNDDTYLKLAEVTRFWHKANFI